MPAILWEEVSAVGSRQALNVPYRDWVVRFRANDNSLELMPMSPVGNGKPDDSVGLPLGPAEGDGEGREYFHRSRQCESVTVLTNYIHTVHSNIFHFYVCMCFSIYMYVNGFSFINM